MKYLSGAPLYDRALALTEKFRLGFTGLPGTNALDYYEKMYLTAVKVFKTLGPGTVFTTLHFIRNLRIGPISDSVT